MFGIALKMLFNDKIKFIALILGITFSALLITQQGSIFCGLMMRTGATILDTNVPIWVFDPKVQAVNDNVPMQENKLPIVRSVDGVAWAVPLLFSNVSAKNDEGNTGMVQLIGVDDETLTGLPSKLISGNIEALNEPEAIIMTKSRLDRFGNPKVGDYIEINYHRAKVVAIMEATSSFTPFPSVYTTYSKAVSFLPPQPKHLTYILAGAAKGFTAEETCRRITKETGLKALPMWDFFWLNLGYWVRNTGIPINFGITISLGIIFGAAVSGQTLYTFMVENTRQFATFKAIGLRTPKLIAMVLLQSLSAAFIGYGIGVGVMSLMGLLMPKNGALAFYTPWQLPVVAAIVVFLFCTLASLISIRRVLSVDPALVFRG
mgnify:CR=1 FL=1